MPPTLAAPMPPISATMRWCRAFPGKPDQARPARAFVACLLADSPALDSGLQVTGEFVANAIRHSRTGLPGGLFVIELRRWRGGVAIAVADQGDKLGLVTELVQADGDPLAEHGRGLRIVDELADSWDCRGGAHGRTFTAILTAG